MPESLTYSLKEKPKRHRRHRLRPNRAVMGLLAILCVLAWVGHAAAQRHAEAKHNWEIRDGKFYRDGEWVFLKVAKPLRNFADAAAVDRLIGDLDVLKGKGYQAIEINCYWHHFDHDGDGVPDVSLAPLNRLVDAIYARGMMPCLSVETYSVGGGQMPAGLWSRFPDAEAVDDEGNVVTDTEYGFGSRVVSIFHEGYRAATRTFIKKLTAGIDHQKILYFETTVEPQYMGTVNLCYSEHARQAYAAWRQANRKEGIAPDMPTTFPIPQSFIENEHWNAFRAQFLAQWVNEDAAAFREVAGERAWVAVDYLDAAESSMPRRLGNPGVFLAHLEAPDIIQVNWSWFFPENAPNRKAYERVRKANEAYGRNWAITEHMTFNGSDFNHFSEAELQQILLNTLVQGTRFGWEFVSVDASTAGSFSLYNDDWTPKRVMATVDNHWEEWMEKVRAIDRGELPE